MANITINAEWIYGDETMMLNSMPMDMHGQVIVTMMRGSPPTRNVHIVGVATGDADAEFDDIVETPYLDRKQAELDDLACPDAANPSKLIQYIRAARTELESDTRPNAEQANSAGCNMFIVQGPCPQMCIKACKQAMGILDNKDLPVGFILN